MAESTQSAAVPKVANLIFQVSNSCNLCCTYCCADYGSYGGISKTMSLDLAHRAIDFLFAETDSDRLAITYFGGEPLLNLDTVLRSARYGLDLAAGRGKQLSLHLVTNGVLLGLGTLQSLDELGFTLTVSLDGPAAIHNANRPFHGGAGSYTRTMLALKAAQSLPIGERITVRGTFTRESAYFFPAVKFLIDEEFSRNISYEPVFLGRSNPLALRWKDLPAVKRAYTDLARYYLAALKEENPFCLWDFDDAIIRLILRRPRQARCGSGVRTVTVTADGDLYGCHLSTGREDAWIGDLSGGMVPARKELWDEVYLQPRPGCGECEILSLCGGGCTTHALYYHADAARPYRLECELIKHRYRLARWILSEYPELEQRLRAHLESRPAESGTGHMVIPLRHLMQRGRGVESLRR